LAVRALSRELQIRTTRNVRLSVPKTLDRNLSKRGFSGDETTRRTTFHQIESPLKPSWPKASLGGAKYITNSQASQFKSLRERKKKSNPSSGLHRRLESRWLLLGVLIPPLAIEIKSTTNLRPSPNERTCMSWHKRHASLRRGWRGIYVPRR